MTTCFSCIVCVIFSFLVLPWFKIKLSLKTKNCRKQINYSRYFAYPFEISHRRKTRFFKKKFPGVWVVFVMHEADNTYSIRSTWSCYWLEQFLTLALNILIFSIFYISMDLSTNYFAHFSGC